MNTRHASPQARPATRPALSGADDSTGPVGIVPLLTVDEVAQRKHYSVETVRRWIRHGRLPAVRMEGGRRLLVEQSAVERLFVPVGPVTTDIDLDDFIEEATAS